MPVGGDVNDYVSGWVGRFEARHVDGKKTVVDAVFAFVEEDYWRSKAAVVPSSEVQSHSLRQDLPHCSNQVGK
jgi:hypothetical protein